MTGFIVYIAAPLCGIIIITGIVMLLRLLISKAADKKIFTFQNDLISKHCTEVENIYNQMRGWRHDYHNHIQTLKAYLALEQLREIGGYLNKLDLDLASVDTILKTGNVMVDAILNSKISLAMSKKINVNAKAAVPRDLTVSEIDLCVVLGNLIDNATEACLALPDAADRIIRIYVDIFNDYLYISVANSMGNEIKKGNSGYISTKGASHGFGLMRIDKIINKYGGHINRQNEEDVFATEVMLPLRSEI